MEHYKPSPDEIKKAEEMMTGEERRSSQNRSEVFEAGKDVGKTEIEKDWNERVWQIDTTPRGERELTEEEKQSSSVKIFDSEKELEPLRCSMYREKGNGDIRFDFFSHDKGDENQSFELVINDKTHAIVKFRPWPVPKGKGASLEQQSFFSNIIIGGDEMADALKNMNKAMLVFRLKRLEKEQK